MRMIWRKSSSQQRTSQQVSISPCGTPGGTPIRSSWRSSSPHGLIMKLGIPHSKVSSSTVRSWRKWRQFLWKLVTLLQTIKIHKRARTLGRTLAMATAAVMMPRVGGRTRVLRGRRSMTTMHLQAEGKQSKGLQHGKQRAKMQTPHTKE